MSYSLLRQITADEDAALLYLRQKLAIRRQVPSCPVCNRDMSSIIVQAAGKYWRCPTHKGRKKSFRDGSFWSKSKIPFTHALEIVFNWSHKMPVYVSAELTGISEHSIVQWYQHLRDITSQWRLANPYTIGGVGVVVQIDETLMAKRKNHQGRVVEQRWVFGGYCPDTKVGFLEMVPDRTANTLEALIRQYIEPGSIIHSDQWPAYNNLTVMPGIQPPYQHLTVNHTRNFVCPVTGACTNHVEVYWKNCKRRFKTMAGVHTSMLPSHLDEFLWRELQTKTGDGVFQAILSHIALMYPTP